MNEKDTTLEAESIKDNLSADKIDYKDINFLKKFISETGKINPRRNGVLTGKDQRRINKAIKIARYLALLPYCDNHKN
ncbi:MAG: 30S ribosomal protein S18 [Pseudomonadota bacterium]|nr:30S ribosomal protein S18 [Pseudomonadota bacterium]